VLTGLPEIVTRIDRLQALTIQRSAVPESISVFRVHAGAISDPITFSLQSPEHTKSQSMEARLQQTLAGLRFPEARTTLEAMEQLAILKRWFYRSSRAGEIFFADEKGELPIRRIVRGMARVYRGEKSDIGASGLDVAGGNA